MRRLVVGFLALVFTSGVDAQQVVAISGLNVRSGQSMSSKIRGHLNENDTASLVSPSKVLGYYHVRTETGLVGWSWAARLRLVTTDTTGPSPSPSPAPSPANAATGIDSNWTKTPTNAADVHWADGNHALCQAAGVGGDDATNVWKNRTDEPTSFHAITWNALATLPFPRNQKSHRGGGDPWKPNELARLAEFEGIPISVDAFLSGVREQLPSMDSKTHQLKKGEATNCGANTSPRVDWHMYLTKSANQSHRLAIVVETTPRVRPSHPGWTLEKMQQISDSGTPVRISGWLMFDPEHWDQMWKYKGPGQSWSEKSGQVG